MEHIVKTQTKYFDAVAAGEKTFELRKDDRNPAYQVGDTLLMLRYDGEVETGRRLRARIPYVYRGKHCKDGYCAISLADVKEAP